MALVVEIRIVNLGDRSADSSCLGIPADMISDCVFRHDALLRLADVVLPIKRGIDRNVSQGAAMLVGQQDLATEYEPGTKGFSLRALPHINYPDTQYRR